MNKLSKEQQRKLVQAWNQTGPELEGMRRKKLQGMPYKWQDVDAVLGICDSYDGPPRTTSGLVEMQRLFMTFARQKRLSPLAVHEAPKNYTVKSNDNP